MDKNYIDTIIETWEKFNNNNEYELYIYSINDLINDMEYDINNVIIDNMANEIMTFFIFHVIYCQIY